MPIAQSLSPPSGVLDATVVKEWLVGYISHLLELDRAEVRTNVSMNRYGLDSMTAMSLTGDLGAWLDREVDPRLLYKQKTIDSLANYVAQNHATMPPRRKK